MRSLKSPNKYRWLGDPQPFSPLTEELRNRVFERDGHQCILCGVYSNLTIDHAIPQSVKVINDEDNLQTLCFDCNIEKRDRTWWGRPLLSKALEKYGSVETLNKFYKRQWLGERWFI